MLLGVVRTRFHANRLKQALHLRTHGNVHVFLSKCHG